jgi:hypothetical protein
LPARALEEGLAATLVEEFERPTFLTWVFPLTGASELKQVLRRIDGLVRDLKGASSAAFSANLIFEKPFQLRKRGVETKLVLGGIQTEPDITLIRNIVAAQMVRSNPAGADT